MNNPAAARGFTLIEVLVVIVLIAIIMSTVMAGFVGIDEQQEVEGYVERMVTRIEMARDRAVQRNREWGIYVERDTLAFAEFDERNGEWIPRHERAYQHEDGEADYRYDVKVEAYQGDSDEEELPDIILFSSGEVTPFELIISSETYATAPWTLSSDGFTRTESVEGELN